jgi:hypothetical protein
VTPTCDYAACGRTGTRTDDGWTFCAQHYKEHRADLHGEPWPPLKPVNLRPLFAPPHGTPSAYRQHYRLGEKPCPACVEAEQRRKQPHNPDSRRGSWYRPIAS